MKNSQETVQLNYYKRHGVLHEGSVALVVCAPGGIIFVALRTVSLVIVLLEWWPGVLVILVSSMLQAGLRWTRTSIER